MLIRVFCVAEQASSRVVLEGGGGGGGGATGLLNKGGGSNRLPGLVIYIIILDPEDVRM